MLDKHTQGNPCEFLRDCVDRIKTNNRHMSSLQLSKKLGISNSALGRIQNRDVAKPNFEIALPIVRAAFPDQRDVKPILKKFYPEMVETLEAFHHGDVKRELVDVGIEEYFKDQETYQFMLLGAARGGFRMSYVQEEFGNQGVKTVDSLIKKKILIVKDNGSIVIGNQHAIDASMSMFSKLLANLSVSNFYLDNCGENWLRITANAVDKEYVMPLVRDVLQRAHSEISKIVQSPTSRGNDVIWIGTVMDELIKSRKEAK